MQTIDNAGFDAAVAGKTCVVDFFATWCGPCRSMEPVLEAVDAEGTPVFKVDVDENPELAARFGVRSLPTFVILKDGQPVDVRVGAMPKGTMDRWVAEHKG